MNDAQQPTPRGGFKTLSIVWASLIGVGLIALAGSVMLPSTKRARVNVEELRRLNQERAVEAAAATQATTEPTAEPATTPVSQSE